MLSFAGMHEGEAGATLTARMKWGTSCYITSIHSSIFALQHIQQDMRPTCRQLRSMRAALVPPVHARQLHAQRARRPELVHQLLLALQQ